MAVSLQANVTGFEWHFDPSQPRDEEGRWEGDGKSDDGVLTEAANKWSGDTLMTDGIQAHADLQLEAGELKPDGELAGERYAAAMLTGVREGDVTEEDIWRGVRAEHADYQVGQEVKFSLGAFSSNESHAEVFARPHSFQPEREPVMFHIAAGDARTIDMNDHVDSSKQWENEHVTGGTFEVTDVSTGKIREESVDEAEATFVTLRQTATP